MANAGFQLDSFTESIPNQKNDRSDSKRSFYFVSVNSEPQSGSLELSRFDLSIGAAEADALERLVDFLERLLAKIVDA